MSNKIRVGVLFGGESAEHEVSLQSAKNVIEAIDRDKYDVVLIGIDKNGQWRLNEQSHYLLNAENPKLIKLNVSNRAVALAPGLADKQLVSLTGTAPGESVDVVFPILHGTNGEDGTVQGLLKLAKIPFVGAGILGSAVGMDKDVMKRLLRDAGIPIGKFLTFSAINRAAIQFDNIVAQLGLPVFVKPANLGSSVGVSKAADAEQLATAVNEAFRFDRKILIEEAIVGREIECAILGNENPQASLPGEVIPRHDFYSYEAKYIDEQGAGLEIPAKLSPETIAKVQQISIAAFQTLCCEGMARVDSFLKENGEVLVNEINTIPGFTKISMYPKLWEVSGVGYRELIDRLIQLALDRHIQEKRLATSYV